jgi:prepilin-type N-terminal cleavage/methylation domain-containing protein
MIKQVKHICRLKSNQNNNRGFTLIELIVIIAVIAVASAILVSSYANIMENQRKKADMTSLQNIDLGVEQILFYDDAFRDIENYVYDKNKVDLIFKVKTDGKKNGYVDVSDAYINDMGPLSDLCPVFYDYLVKQVGEEIILTSPNYRDGCYIVYITFNGVQLSEIRDFVISNDGAVITNSGDSQLLGE